MSKNKITTIIIGLGFIAVLGVLFWLGWANVSNPASQANIIRAVNPNLKAEEELYDFGTISMAAGLVNRDFKVRNIGNESIRIEKLYTSCMCTEAHFIQNGKKTGPFGMPGHGFVVPLRKDIAPNEEVTIAVTFDPAAHGPAGLGIVERQIYFEGKSSLLLTLGFQANVTP